ncbi:MAG: O-antigen ligase family protein [Verrucomicrobiota bacterium]
MDQHSPRDYSELQKPLENFRTKAKRLKVHPMELAVLWVVSIHFIFLPWAIGTMRPWGQAISLGLAVIGFLLALMPRNYTTEHTGAAEFRLLTWPKLVKFPVFWIGLALLGYVVLQANNPAWTYKTDGKTWWMTKTDFTSWLPRGTSSSFTLWNQWRMLLIYTSAWLTVCTIWIAFTRRRTVQFFLLALGINGLLLAIFGVAQRFSGTEKIYGFYVSQNPQFFASFVYKNHGAAYLFLALVVTCGLAGWYYLRGLRRMEKSNPSGVIAFFATCIAVAILTSYARGVTLTMLAFLLACLVAFIIHQWVIPKENRKPLIAVVLVIIFGYFLKTGFDTLASKEAWDRLKAGIAREDFSLELRERATKASLEMLNDTWTHGIGAGSYRFLFPIYQHRYPELTTNTEGRNMFWEHAHNDIVQIPIEFGAVGTALILLIVGYFLVRLLRGFFWENPLSSCLILGALLLVGYSWWDFPFQNPAILITWWALWPLATMWAQFEESGAQS